MPGQFKSHEGKFYNARGDEIGEYEFKRLEKIDRNNEKLISLGLGPSSMINMREKKQKGKKRMKPKVRPAPFGFDENGNAVTRTSNRLKGDGSNLKMLADEELLYEVEDGMGGFRPETDEEKKARIEEERAARSGRRSVRRMKNDDYGLTEDDIKKLEENMDMDTYLEKLFDYLTNSAHKVSEANRNNVMKRVRQLASGEGIRYESPNFGWPEGIYFARGEKINPTSDLVSLFERAIPYSDGYAEELRTVGHTDYDHSNGWLLKHPIKKLLQFQQYCLNNPRFLATKANFTDYEKSLIYSDDECEYDEGECNEGNSGEATSKDR